MSKSSIAIVGLGCLFPGAHSPQELWQNILAGRRMFRRMPDERLPRSEYFDPNPAAPGKTYCDQMAVISDWEFDPLKFRISPTVANASDIAHWVALWTAEQAVKDAKLDFTKIDRSRVGVILGNTLAGEFHRSHALQFRWPYVERALKRSLKHNHISGETAEFILNAAKHAYKSPLPEVTEDSLAGNMANTIVGRICNYYDFGGGGYTVDGACSSSLLSVVHACNALISDEMDVVLTGGVDISLDPFEIVGFAKTQALARDDIRPYDERANGMITGEGCGVIVLMREDDARRAGYPIYAIVKGWGYSSDGAGAITAPVAKGQARALQRAYDKAGYPASSVGLFEGHGTGTPLGDKIEIAALRSLIDTGPDYGPCWIGSIKSNIGHCKAAAGAAGLIKATMALKRKILPPSMNCDRPTTAFDRPMARLRPTVRGTIWRESTVPRRASVSSMGFGGANSHVTLEEADPETPPLQEDLQLLGSHQKTEVIFLSADTNEALLHHVQHIRSIANRISRAELTDLSAALAANTTHGILRIAIVTDAPWTLESTLGQIKEKLQAGEIVEAVDNPQGGVFAQRILANPKLAIVFPGQASQVLNMGEYLFRAYPFVRSFSRQVDEYISDLMADGENKGLKFRFLLNTYTCPEEKRQQIEAALRDTRIAQPCITFCSIALLKVLTWLGLKPEVAIGHSLGEISALHAMGGIDDLGAVRIAALRGHAMASLDVEDKGAMAALFTDASSVTKLLENLAETQSHNLAISNFNSPSQTVVSGNEKEIRALVALCEQQQVRAVLLPVSHAFHSAIVAPAAQQLEQALEKFTLHTLQGNVVSTATGDVLPSESNIAQLLGQQIQNPVRFTDAIKVANEKFAPDLWLEVGPGSVLTRFVQDILGEQKPVCLPTDIVSELNSKVVNEFMARAFVIGLPLKTEVLFEHRFHRQLSLENFAPKFITNPCERPVDFANLPASDSFGAGMNGLMPQGIEQDAFADYLDGNKEFIKDFVALDYARNSNSQRAPEKSSARTKSATSEVHEPAEQKSLLDQAISWISARTGFPVGTIKPDMKLRDDLNLDSIKVGELHLVLSQLVGGVSNVDSSRFVNAPLSELVEHFRQLAHKPSGPNSVSRRDHSAFEVAELSSVWTRSFHMEYLPYGMDNEQALPVPDTGDLVVICPTQSSRRPGVIRHLEQQGHRCHSHDFYNLDVASLPEKASALIVVLPSRIHSFITQSETEFEKNTLGTAKTIYQIFQWLASKGKETSVIVARDTSGDLADSEGIEGFLKSFNLDFERQSKYLLLPSSWADHKWAEAITLELKTGGTRCIYRYLENGERQTQMAVPVPIAEAAPLPLDQGNVVIVTGGAKGITFEMALALAKRTQCKLALFGSSAHVPNSGSTSSDEITRNLARAADEGIMTHYFQCDVTNLANIKHTVQQVQDRLGAVTGILHGAGIQTVNLFDRKPLEEFMACLNVKMRGLYNLVNAISPKQLKCLHVISSILGKTGMRGNTDYTYANAWLDSAVRQLTHDYPQLRCLSMGYSVWGEVGMGKKLGALDYLNSIGVKAIPPDQGVAEYLSLLDHRDSNPVYITTASLVPELENALYVPVPKNRGRFIEKALHWVPGVELVAESTLSHQDDYYLAEHIFEGTSLFPGVMAIEAMAQAAQILLSTSERPLFRNVRFERPLITPENTPVSIRIYAVAVSSEGMGSPRARVFIRSDRDGNQSNHFSADCIFGESLATQMASTPCPEHDQALDLDPETLSPVPLFQGKFFRRIKTIYRRAYENESVTRISLPRGAQYFSANHPAQLTTVEPAIQDAILQACAIILPPGSLPEAMDLLGMSSIVDDIICQVLVRDVNAHRYVLDVNIFTLDGSLCEKIEGLVVGVAQGGDRRAEKRVQQPTRAASVQEECGALLPNIPLAIRFVAHAGYANTFTNVGAPNPRFLTTNCNLIAARLAAIDYARTHMDVDIGEYQVLLDHDETGKPLLRFLDPKVSALFDGIDISISDTDGHSVAAVGVGSIGVDVELVKNRSAETWRGLLNNDGYDLAMKLTQRTGETFDLSATRIWTINEAFMKSNRLNRMLPVYSGPLGGAWHAFSVETEGREQDVINTSVILDDYNLDMASLTISVRKGA